MGGHWNLKHGLMKQNRIPQECTQILKNVVESKWAMVKKGRKIVLKVVIDLQISMGL